MVSTGHPQHRRVAADGVDHGHRDRHVLGEDGGGRGDGEAVEMPVRAGGRLARSVNPGVQMKWAKKLT